MKFPPVTGNNARLEVAPLGERDRECVEAVGSRERGECSGGALAQAPERTVRGEETQTETETVQDGLGDRRVLYCPGLKKRKREGGREHGLAGTSEQNRGSESDESFG